MKISRRDLGSLVNSLRDFLKAFFTASKCLHILLTNQKTEIGSTMSKNNLFNLYSEDIIENPNRQNHSWFRVEIRKTCISYIKKFQPYKIQFILTKVVYLDHRGVHHVYKNRYYVANKCGKKESKFDV